jgi:hypothetical protein
MKTAKEMFEELGYEPTKTIIDVFGYTKKGVCFIWFYTQTKQYRCRDLIYDGMTLSIEEHKAIHQQMKELGWLDE